MFPERVEKVQRVMDSFLGGPETAGSILELIHPECECQDYPGFPDGEWHYGHKGAVAWALKIWKVLDAIELEAGDFTEGANGRVLVKIRASAVGRQSGAPASGTFYSVVAFKDDKIARLENYYDRTEAFEAAGLEP